MAAQCVIDKVKHTTGLNRAKLLQRLLGPAFFQGNANACYLQSYCAYYDVARRDIKYIEGFRMLPGVDTLKHFTILVKNSRNPSGH